MAAGDIDKAAQLIAQAISSGNADVVAAATSLCATAGKLMNCLLGTLWS